MSSQVSFQKETGENQHRQEEGRWRRHDGGGREVGVGAWAEGGRQSQNLMGDTAVPWSFGSWHPDVSPAVLSWTADLQDCGSQCTQS